ncbi:MAG: hypothetical protein AB1346_11840 [Thermodesulfobacteriota bacterium]
MSLRRAARALLPFLIAALSVPAAAADPASPAAAPKAAASAEARAAAAPQADRAELAARERELRAEEERLLALRKEVEGKIAKYEKLLADAETKGKKEREEGEAKSDQLVKLFEGMPPEDAAARLEALDEKTASFILGRMKGRKASNVLAVMDPKHAASLVRRMAGGVKNFPAE